jgi:hypothetical protein
MRRSITRRSHRSAQRLRWLLRSIRPTRATRGSATPPVAASECHDKPSYWPLTVPAREAGQSEGAEMPRGSSRGSHRAAATAHPRLTAHPPSMLTDRPRGSTGPSRRPLRASNTMIRGPMLRSFRPGDEPPSRMCRQRRSKDRPWSSRVRHGACAAGRRARIGRGAHRQPESRGGTSSRFGPLGPGPDPTIGPGPHSRRANASAGKARSRVRSLKSSRSRSGSSASSVRKASRLR